MTGPSDSSVQVEALKPCPFCGAPGYLVGGVTTYEVKCTDTGCTARGREHPNRRKAIAAWNRRAALPVAPSDERITDLALKNGALHSGRTSGGSTLYLMTGADLTSFACALLAQVVQPLPVAELSDVDRKVMEALTRAKELGEVEMDWLGTGTDSRGAAKERREYLALIDEAIAALRTRLLRHSEGKE